MPASNRLRVAIRDQDPALLSTTLTEIVDASHIRLDAVNGIEIGTWTSPADFGGERGLLTPVWWETNNTQYGLLKIWQVNHDGSYIDGQRISNLCLADIGLSESEFISIRIGVKPDSYNVGGINLFGSKFGNYPQDIVLNIRYV